MNAAARVPSLSPFARVGAKLRERSYHPLPIRPGKKSPGSHTGTRWEGLTGWSRYCGEPPADDDVELWATWPNAGVGVAHGAVVALDTDTDREDVAEAVRTALGVSPARRRGSKGFAAYYRASDDLAGVGTKLVWHDADGVVAIELLMRGTQSVLPPSVHPKTQRPYEWIGEQALEDTDPDELPLLNLAGVEQLDRELEKIEITRERRDERADDNVDLNEGREAASMGQHADILRLMATKQNKLDYDGWVKLGYALKFGCGEAVRPYFIEFSKTWPGVPEEDPARTWDGLRPSGAAKVESAFRLLHDLPPVVQVSLPQPEGAQQTKAAFALVRADSLEFVENEFLVEGLIEIESLSMMFGEPGCGKSFVAIDMAASVATGRSYHGRETRQGAVIYLAGEGFNGLAKRRTAWEMHNKASLEGAPLYFSRVAAQILDGESVKAVAEAIDHIAQDVGDIALIVVDTMARNFGPGDENSTADMSRFVAGIDAIKDRYDAAAMIVHHSGHQEKGRGRGSIVLKGSVDHEYRIEASGPREEKFVTATNTKMKDGPPPDPVRFELVEVDLERVDRRGELVTGAALALADPPPKFRPKLTETMDMALTAFEVARMEVAAPHAIGAEVPLDAWRAEFYRRHTGDNADAKRKAFQRVRQDLVKRGEIAVDNDMYRRTLVPSEDL